MHVAVPCLVIDTLSSSFLKLNEIALAAQQVLANTNRCLHTVLGSVAQIARVFAGVVYHCFHSFSLSLVSSIRIVSITPSMRAT